MSKKREIKKLRKELERLRHIAAANRIDSRPVDTQGIWRAAVAEYGTCYIGDDEGYNIHGYL